METTTINLSSLNGSNGFRLDGVSERERSGISVSDAGDVNGDGFDDVVVGARFANPSGDWDTGSSYVVLGKASGFDATLDLSSLDGSNGFRLDGVDVGSPISNAGDVNGDSFDDLIIGAPDFSAGSSYVVFGRNTGFDTTLDLSDLDGKDGFRLDGKAGDFVGNSVSGAGDLNGDGFDDLIIGADRASPNGVFSAGSSYIVFGKASGFDATMDLSSLNGSNGFRLDGEYDDDHSGGSLSNAGDINSDGFDDLIIGAHGSGRNGLYSGSSYIVFGKASGFDATMDLSSLNGSNGFRLDGEEEFGKSGRSVSSAGDINGDGFDDVIIGAPEVDSNSHDSGSSYIVFGKASGFDATMDLSSLNGSNGFRLDGEYDDDIDDHSGFSVSHAGDINGDSLDDLIIGTREFVLADEDSYSHGAGASYVVFGKNTGFDATMDLSSLNGSNGFRVDGASSVGRLGWSVSGAGDINGDGFDDVMVGTSWADPHGIYDAGSSYVIFGRSHFTGGNVIKGTSGNDRLKGTLEADIFGAEKGNDTMIGRGGADIFHADAGNAHIKVTDLSFRLVEGGISSDVLHLDGSNLDLDLVSSSDRISGIETICLYGTGNNTLTLTAEDLLNLSDSTNTLKVHGNAGDRIVIDNEWVDRGSHGFYHTYIHDDAVLLVGHNMTTEFA